MRVLILEDDVLMAELLETILAGLYARLDADIVSTKAQALAALDQNTYQLLICDWNLPDGSGLEVVRAIRKQDNKLPVLMISGRTDRESVLAAAHYGIRGFISKPFKVETVRDRLKSIFPPESDLEAANRDLEQMLADACEGHFQLPTTLEASELLALLERPEALDVAQLTERWRDETGLTARLLDVANRSSFRRTGEPVTTLAGAIKVIGTEMSLNLALGLALDTTHALSDSQLREQAEAHQRQGEAVGREASAMFRTLGLGNGVNAYTAGLLSRVGELVVLSVLQQFLDGGGTLDRDTITQTLAAWSQPCGNRQKVQWRLPLDLRELIGAIHRLPRGTSHRERVVMRVAALQVEGAGASGECLRLMRFAGLESRAESSVGDNGE